MQNMILLWVFVLNNVAIGAHYAMNQYKLNRIAIIDFDTSRKRNTNSFYKNDKVSYPAYMNIHFTQVRVKNQKQVNNKVLIQP